MKNNAASRATRPGLSLAILLAGSLLVAFSSGRWLAPLAAWMGPVLLIRFARDHRVSRGLPLVIAGLVVAFVIGFGAIWQSFGALAVPIFGIAYGILWSLPYLADRLTFARLRGFSSTFVYPLAATTLEFVYIRTSPLGAWGATGFTQYGDLPLMQLASVTGMIGITFLMGWFASVVNWAWESRGRGVEIRRGLGAFGIVFAAVLIFGFVRLNFSPASGTVRVAGITAQSLNTLAARLADVSDPAMARPEVLAHWDAYFEATVREAQAGAKVVIWPEVSAAAPPQWGAEPAPLIARAQEVARQNGIYLALPLYVGPSDPAWSYENKVLLIDPTGAIAMEHIKYGGSISEAGRRIGDRKLRTVATPFGVLSAIICYDADYPTVVKQTAGNGTGLLIVPSKDWLEIDPVHTHMAVFRAIENGTSLWRQTDAGLSIAVDPYGRVLAQTDFFTATDRTMVAQVPVKHVATLYGSFGGWFEWLCLAGFLLVMARALTTRPATKV